MSITTIILAVLGICSFWLAISLSDGSFKLPYKSEFNSQESKEQYENLKARNSYAWAFVYTAWGFLVLSILSFIIK